MRSRFLTTVSAIVVGLSLGGAACATSEAAAELAGVDTLVQFDFPEAPLSDVLLEFTDITGLGLVFDSRLVADKMAPAISGEFSAIVALDLLLAESGLRVVNVGGDTLAIVPARADADTARHDEDVVMPEVISTDFEANYTGVVDELLILGTRTANPPYHKFKPTVAVSGEDLQFGGTSNVSDYLFQLPSMLSDVTAANTTVLGTPAGLNLADLRGLGTERTLVMINGRRVIPTLGGSLSLYGVDLNSIPAALVERIDVINGGASTSYGVEAVAGVVNFTLSDDIEGWRGAVQGGITRHGDREEWLATLTYGTKFAGGKGRVVASLTRDSQSGLLMKDRAVTANPSGYAQDGIRTFVGVGELTPGFGGSLTSPQGIWDGIQTETGGLRFLEESYYLSEDGTQIEPFIQRQDQLYNYAPHQTLLTPLERSFATLNASYDVASGHKVFFEGSYANTDVISQLAPLPLTLATGLASLGGEVITVPISNPFVPDSILERIAAEGIENPSGVLVMRRLVALGTRRTYISRETSRGLVGMQGMVMPGWSYDLYYQYGRNDVTEERDGLLDVLNYRAALDPDLCAQVAGCSVINPFGVGHITEDQAAFLKAPNAIRNIRAEQHIASMVVSGPADFFTDLDGQISLGVEYRHEAFRDQPDERLDERPVSGTLIYPGSRGSFDAVEAFADLTLPLVSDRPMIKELTATTGARVSDFSTTGTLLNWHVGGVWSPSDTLAFRVSRQSGRRAPNIAELYSGGAGGFANYQDPCSDRLEDDNSVVAQNCRSDGPLGVPDGFIQSQLLVDRKTYGNPRLEAEHSSNVTVGGTFETADILGNIPGRLRVSADFYRIKVENFIVSLEAPQVLGLCYQSVDLSHPFCGTNPVTGTPYIARNTTTGDLSQVTGTMTNGGLFQLKGFDVDIQYVADLTSMGRDALFDQISLAALYTRNLEVAFQADKDSAKDDLLGTAKYPKHRFQAGISLTRDRFTVDWDVRYRGKAVSYAGLADLPDSTLDAVWYHDLGVRFGVNNDVTFYGGVRNLFNQKAPSIYLGSVGDTFPEYYDTLGQRFYAGVVFEF